MTVPAATAQISYTDLYSRWEEGNWSATQIDFTQDKIDWQERLTDDQRKTALWNFSVFFHGEHEVAEVLWSFIAAAPEAEQRYFLMTQQVDEARHSMFFTRFLHEVAGVGDGSTDLGLSISGQQLTPVQARVFGRLDKFSNDLRKDPSPERLAVAVAYYHLFIEAALAQPVQHQIEQALERLDVLPGFREGMRQIAFDEQRHIGFGVKLISDLLQRDPSIQDAIVDLYANVLPDGATFGRPPNWDPSYLSLGYSLEDIYEDSLRAVEGRLRSTGIALEQKRRFPLPLDISARERSENLLKAARAGLVGPGDQPATPDPDALAIFFDLMRRRADPTKLPTGTVIQWDFSDAEPWYIEFADSGPRAVRGRAPKPDLSLRVALQDWVDVAAGRASAPRLMLSRRLRPKGKLRVLGRLDAAFA